MAPMLPNVSAPSYAPWRDKTMKPLVQFENVSKHFGAETVLENVTLDIYEGEFFALLGPSGCGKTTMMRLLAGFEDPSEGRLLLGGENLSPIPAYRRPVNMMFQSYALFPHMNVAANIAFGLKQAKWPKADIQDRVAEMLALVQLERFAKRKAHQLSGGQRQRVALARSLALKPKLLLLDEPLGALDKKLREQTQFELIDIQEKLGMTFIIVTHDQEEAMVVASRIAVMNEGKLVQVATPEQIYEHPQNCYVADFIGDVNLISGRLGNVMAQSATLSWAEGQRDLLLDPRDQTCQNDEQAWLAIRPEKVDISHIEPVQADNRIQGNIIDIAYIGNISTYYIKLANGFIFKAQETNQQRLVHRHFTWEDQVWVSWQYSAAILLKN